MNKKSENFYQVSVFAFAVLMVISGAVSVSQVVLEDLFWATVCAGGALACFGVILCLITEAIIVGSRSSGKKNNG